MTNPKTEHITPRYTIAQGKNFAIQSTETGHILTSTGVLVYPEGLEVLKHALVVSYSEARKKPPKWVGSKLEDLEVYKEYFSLKIDILTAARTATLRSVMHLPPEVVGKLKTLEVLDTAITEIKADYVKDQEDIRRAKAQVDTAKVLRELEGLETVAYVDEAIQEEENPIYLDCLDGELRDAIAEGIGLELCSHGQLTQLRKLVEDEIFERITARY